MDKMEKETITGMEPFYRRFLPKEYEKWGELLKEKGMSLDEYRAQQADQDYKISLN